MTVTRLSPVTYKKWWRNLTFSGILTYTKEARTAQKEFHNGND